MNDSYSPAASGHWLFSMCQWNMLKCFDISPLPRKSIPVIRVGPEPLFFVSMWRFVHFWSYIQYGRLFLLKRIFILFLPAYFLSNLNVLHQKIRCVFGHGFLLEFSEPALHTILYIFNVIEQIFVTSSDFFCRMNSAIIQHHHIILFCIYIYLIWSII